MGDIEVNYLQEGRGDCIAFVHGIGGSLRDFEPLVPKLGRRWKCLRYDQRGFGDSDKPLDRPYSTELWADDLHRLLTKLHSGKTAIVGHSMGGRIACHFAAKYPAQTAAIVALDTTMWGSNPEGAKELREGIQKLPKQGMKVFVEGTPWSRSLNPRYSRIAKMEEEDTLANDPSAYALAAESVAADFAGETVYSFLGRIRCPALIVVGDRDSAPLQGAIEMHKQIRGSFLGVIPECGHFSIYEKPRILTSMLIDFMSNLSK